MIYKFVNRICSLLTTCLKEYLSNVEDVSRGDGTRWACLGTWGLYRTVEVEDVVSRVRVYCETEEDMKRLLGSSGI